MKIRTWTLVLVLVLATSGMLPSIAAPDGKTEQPSILPAQGYVPNAETAVKIAEAVLIPLFGEKEVVGQRPYCARLVEDTWVIDGTVKSPPGVVVFGGQLTVHIARKDGRIIDAFQWQ